MIRLLSTAVLLASMSVAAAAQTQQVAVPKSQFTRELNIDRSGNDIKSEKLAVDASVDDCEKRCIETSGCVAFTFVKKSTTVPLPICWLKNTAPYGHQSSCCISGVQQR